MAAKLFLFLFFSLCCARSLDQSVITDPRSPEAGNETLVRFSLKDMASEDIHHLRWSNISILNTKKFHVVFVSNDMKYFGHMHPEEFSATAPNDDDDHWSVPFIFPKKGRYSVGTDFGLEAVEGDIRTIIYNGKELRHYQYVDEIIVSEGDDELTEVNEDTIRVKNFESVTYDGEEMKKNPVFLPQLRVENLNVRPRLNDGKSIYKVTMSVVKPENGKIIANECVALKFSFESYSPDGETSHKTAPTENLAPYLDAAAHFLIAREGQTVGTTQIFNHIHGFSNEEVKFNSEQEVKQDLCTEQGQYALAVGVPESFGPDITLHFRFFREGYFTIIGQTGTSDNSHILFDFGIQVERDPNAGGIPDLTPGSTTSPGYVVSQSAIGLLFALVALCGV